MDIRIEGAEQLAIVGKRLRGADKQLRKDLLAGIRQVGRPLNEAAKASALAELPSKGGLNRVVARSRMSVQTRTGGKQVGVRLKATNAHDIGAMDRRGRLRHPVYGNRKAWVTQQIRTGWYTRPLEQRAPLVRDHVMKAIERTAHEIEKG